MHMYMGATYWDFEKTETQKKHPYMLPPSTVRLKWDKSQLFPFLTFLSGAGTSVAYLKTFNDYFCSYFTFKSKTKSKEDS